MQSFYLNAIFSRYFADEYGYVSGVKEMKKEIWKRGPIGCGVDATAKFDAWVEKDQEMGMAMIF